MFADSPYVRDRESRIYEETPKSVDRISIVKRAQNNNLTVYQKSQNKANYAMPVSFDTVGYVIIIHTKYKKFLSHQY